MYILGLSIVLVIQRLSVSKEYIYIYIYIYALYVLYLRFLPNIQIFIKREHLSHN